MNVTYVKTEPLNLNPNKAWTLLKRLYLNTGNKTAKKELEPFIFDYAPSERDETWASAVCACIERHFAQLPKQKSH